MRGPRGPERPGRIKAGDLLRGAEQEPARAPWLEGLLTKDVWEEVDADVAKCIRRFRSGNDGIIRNNTTPYIKMVILARELFGKSDAELRLTPAIASRYNTIVHADRTRNETSHTDTIRSTVEMAATASQFLPGEYNSAIPSWLHDKLAAKEVACEHHEEQMQLLADYRMAAPHKALPLNEVEMEQARTGVEYTVQYMTSPSEDTNLMLEQLANIRLASSDAQWATLDAEFGISDKLAAWAEYLTQFFAEYAADDDGEWEYSTVQTLKMIHDYRIIAAAALNFTGPGRLEIQQTIDRGEQQKGIPDRNVV